MKNNLVLALATLAFLFTLAGAAHADIRYVSGYSRGNGSYVHGHYRDTSNDGNPYNNANALGYND